MSRGSTHEGNTWLIEHSVTLDECFDVSETIGFAISVYQSVTSAALGKPRIMGLPSIEAQHIAKAMMESVKEEGK